MRDSALLKAVTEHLARHHNQKVNTENAPHTLDVSFIYNSKNFTKL